METGKQRNVENNSADSSADDSALADRIADTIRRERPRLRAWLRRHVPDAQDVDDILQDAFYELVLASRLIAPVRNAGAWLFTVVRNRVTDGYRWRGRHAGLLVDIDDDEHENENGGASGSLADLMADADADPERRVARMRFIVALEDALRALPDDQRAVFIAHEIDGVSFKAMAQTTGASVNTLLSRKHAAIKALRMRLQTAHDALSRD
jgi:RNA polymerase sigma factor (sigma-70 family)